MRGKTRDHGGDLDRAIETYGAGEWLDLSTGINPRPYPLPDLPSSAWKALPTKANVVALEIAAAEAYGTKATVVALAGAQAAIQLVPRLSSPARAVVFGPTYNEHAGALLAQGWRAETISEVTEADGAALATVVNPNNPDGRRWTPETLIALSKRVGLLIVDESFADTDPDHSIASLIDADCPNIVVLRSFGKFFGLAGLRLGFTLSGDELAEQIRSLAGPWAVSGPALAVGCAALADADWQAQTRERLKVDAARLDRLALDAGWALIGGTDLFRTYKTPDAKDAQAHLATHKVWSRIFPYSNTWIRLGLPGTNRDWTQLTEAMALR